MDKPGVPSTSKEEIDSNSDCRIKCTNYDSVKKIINVVQEHNTAFCEASNSICEKEKFVSRFNDVFKDVLQQNITVNGLPWVDGDNLTVMEKEQHKQEADDELLSNLSKTIQITARKRKTYPGKIRRILNMTLKQERHQLKRAKIEHSTELPEMPALPATSKVDWVPLNQKFSEIAKQFTHLQNEFQTEIDEIKRTYENIKFAADIVRRQKPVQETLNADEIMDIT